MKKLFLILLVSVSAFAADYEVISVSADPVINYFFTLIAIPALVIAGFAMAISLFKL